MNERRFRMVETLFARREQKISVTALQIFYAATLMLIVNPVAFSFPLTTEDTGTLIQGHSKIELNSERSEDQMNGAQEVSVSNELAFVHGLRDNLNAFVTVPYHNINTQEADGSSSSNRGLGDARIGLKWRYFEQGDFSLGFKGGITAPTGDTAKGLGNGQATYAINAIASYETALLAYHFNLGYTWLPNTNNQRELIENISTAVAFKLSSSWKVMADIGVAGNKNKASNEVLAYVGAGLSYKLRQDLSLDMGVKYGLTNVQTDSAVLIGINQIF